MPHRLTVDRIEGEQAVCEREDGTSCAIPLRQLPAQTKEGDILQWTGTQYLYLEAETRQRRAQMQQKLRQVTSKGKTTGRL